MTTYEFMIDWDAQDWSFAPYWSGALDNITPYVKSFFIDRGKNNELGNTPAGILDVTLNNASRRFSPPNNSSPLYGKIRPWLPVRVRATVNGSTEIIYIGFISRISVDPNPDILEAYLYCTDGLDLLARNMVTVDKTNRGKTSDGGAVHFLLDAAGWSADNRVIDTDGGEIVQYPSVSEY